MWVAAATCSAAVRLSQRRQLIDFLEFTDRAKVANLSRALKIDSVCGGQLAILLFRTLTDVALWSTASSSRTMIGGRSSASSRPPGSSASSSSMHLPNRGACPAAKVLDRQGRRPSGMV